ncbi:transcription factor VOZ1-like isoform X1 [Corylus avellana]|uniref:transcription factor VOZ1-like isoform X1 n=1 Tax=Corylus avellana TaxID=13451 RepID=UPI001E1F9A3E|nr:transcription factor VOZ1-like isoform X1 [Corylus avellana]XP_059449306.1 transcription factor VOZ1-like isoform X1 [Corylus avellana]
MPKGLKSKCGSESHQYLKENAKNRVNDLEGAFSDLQSARKESRANDIALLEQQVHQMLREWKSELNESSPASSLVGGSLGSFSEELARFLQNCDEEDDATSPLKELTPLKSEADNQNLHARNLTAIQEDIFVNKQPQEHGFHGFDQCRGSVSSVQNKVVNSSGFTNSHHLDIRQDVKQNTAANNSDSSTKRDFHQLDLHEDLDYGLLIGANGTKQCEQDAMPNVLPNICPPPSAFLGPKCALWDCFRPAQGSKWCEDYCSTVHAVLALNEGLPGMTPILRPGGISLKDGPLFATLNAKTQGKEVGIPQCEGAASRKSPWNNPELFDLAFLEGETIREWLFFDKPRRAFDSGNRKQRSLPDYNGRGWHESRKLVMKEYGGRKRSYYMDPQPLKCLEWHLYEYEISNCDACALYRLELKLVDEKKSPKGKLTTDSLADLQKKMGRLTAEVSADNGHLSKDRTTANQKADAGNTNSDQNQITSTSESPSYGLSAPYGYHAST